VTSARQHHHDFGTAEQRELLEAAGCDVGEGFLLGRPADAAATTKLLLARA
jgi:EAL domain-containing protein (putative c-di-GMP-specific phosphodiesterase class I)